jgi:hypothetical protein
MTPELRGIQLRSNPEPYVLASGITFKTDFLARARHMAAPVVDEIDIVFSGTVGGITGGVLARDCAKLYDTIRIRDSQDIVNASGAGMRVWEQMELGERQTDGPAVASGATNTAYNYRMRIPFNSPLRAHRGSDFSIPLAHFLEGGEITIQTPAALPTGWAAVQSDQRVTLVAYVRDERVRELKSNRRIREEALTQQEFDYQINGFLRAAIITSKLTTTLYTELLALYATLNSRTLQFPASFQTYNLVDDYRFSTRGFSSTDEFLLTATTAGALGLVVPEVGQMTGQMIDLKSLHIDLQAAAPTGGRLLTDVVIDRNGDLAAITEGYPSAGALANAALEMGKVNGGGGRKYAAKGFNGALARKLPLRIERP